MPVKPTMHDQIVSLLEQSLETAEASSVQAPRIVALAGPIIRRIRREQAYDPEVMELLDRLERLGTKAP